MVDDIDIANETGDKRKPPGDTQALLGVDGVTNVSMPQQSMTSNASVQPFLIDGNTEFETVTEKAHKNSFSQFFKNIGYKAEDLRNTTIKYTPDLLVDNAVTVIALMHLVSEIAMFKASGVNFFKNNRNGGKVNPIIDPARNLYRAITGADKDKLLQNHWSTRSTLSGFTAWTLGSFIPDSLADKETENEGAAQPNNLFTTTGNNLLKSIQIGNPNTKRQQVGLLQTGAGVFSAISGFNNINIKTGKRFTNWSHAIGGGITALAGSQLLIHDDPKKAWQGLGSVFLLQTPLAVTSTLRKYRGGDRWGYYGGGKLGFQAAAVVAYLIGGAKKEHEPDETIEQTPEQKDNKERPQEAPDHKHPDTEIVAVAEHSAERVEEKAPEHGTVV